MPLRKLLHFVCVCVRLPRSMTHILMSCLEVLPPLGSMLTDNVTSSISLKPSLVCV